MNGDEVRILELAFTFQGADSDDDFDEVEDKDDLVVAGEDEA